VTSTEESDATEAGTNLSVGETYETEDGMPYSVRDVHIHRSIRTTSVGSGSHLDMAWLSDHQFAVVETDLPTPDSGLNFHLSVDGTKYPTEGQHWYWAIPPDSWNPPGFPTFPAPITDATDAAIVWNREGKPTVRWQLSPATIKQFNRPPAFEIPTFDVPDSVQSGDTFDVTFTVENVSEYDGRFLFEFGAGPVSDFGESVIDLPSGATQTHEREFEADFEDVNSMPVVLDYGKQRIQYEVKVN